MTLKVDPGPASALSAPRFLDAGEAALVVEFGDIVDPAINDRVLAIDAAVWAPGSVGFLGRNKLGLYGLLRRAFGSGLASLLFHTFPRCL